MSKRQVNLDTVAGDLQKLRDEVDLEDDGEIKINCSSCNAHLVTLVVVRPSSSLLTKIIVECCKCGDKSFQQTVQGMFAMSPGKNVSISNTDIVEQKKVEEVVEMSVIIKTR